MIEIQNDLFPEEIRKSWDVSVERVISAYRFSQNLGMGKLFMLRFLEVRILLLYMEFVN